MKLKTLRPHYQSKDNLKWTPKRAFITVEEIEQKLGFRPSPVDIYRCKVCGYLHISKGERKYKKR